MNPRLRITIALLIVAVIAVCVWLALDSRDPRYEGKKLSEWLDQYRRSYFGSGTDPEAATAIRTIGTNAIPLLLKYLSVNDSALRKQIVQFAEKQEVFKVNIPSANDYHGMANCGFHALGALGKPAIPSLVVLMNDTKMNDTNVGPFAVQCLRSIGEDAVGGLIQGLNNTNSEIRRLCVWGLGELGTNHPPALPALLATLNDPDLGVRDAAIWAAGGFKHKHREVVSALAEKLGSRDQIEIGSVARVISQFGSNALPALPRLEQTLLAGISSWTIVAACIDKISPRTAIPAVLKLLADPNTQDRDVGAQVLGRFSGVTRNDAAAVFDLARSEQVPRVFLQFRMVAHQILARARSNAVPELATFKNGFLVRGPLSEKRVAICLWGDLFSEGADVILNELELHQAKASFFLTDKFPADQEAPPLIDRLFGRQHYVGNTRRSFDVLAYEEYYSAFWPRFRVTRDASAQSLSEADANSTSRRISQFNIEHGLEDFFLPSSDAYTGAFLHASAIKSMTIIAPTPGTLSGLDGTHEGQTNFVSSQAIFDSILQCEREGPNGLNGFILMFHLGSGPGRTDKFHPRFGELLDALATRGYSFVRVDELFEPNGKQEGAH